MKIKVVGIVGAGTMGAGISVLFALNRYEVILVDKSEKLARKGVDRVLKRLKEPQREVSENFLKTSSALSDLEASDFIVEAVFEDELVKKNVLASISECCAPDTIIASNTSSISITSLSESVKRPIRFIGMHFMNPPVVMKMIEIVRGKHTSDKTVKLATGMARSLNKEYAVVNDSPGFVSNRLLFALINEAFKLLETGIAEKAEIDKVMKYGMNHPMGPIELADFIGLDVCLEILEYLFKTLQDERFKPGPVLTSLVKAGKLGKKSGEGFYKYVN